MSIALEKQILSKMQKSKPKKSSKELVQKMIDKGIDISPYSSEDVETYLLNSNNFFRVCSYRKNYQKYLNGKNKGRYIGLSFDQLKALAILDMKIRKSLLGMCLDVEHSLKLYILKDFENSQDDGYGIVQDYFKTPNGCKTADNIIQKKNNIYVSDLAAKYVYPWETEKIYSGVDSDGSDVNVDLPIWAMLELMSFGDLLNFYFYYYELKTENSERPPIPKNVLHKVKNIRNACAHNNCILNHLYDKSARVPSSIGEFAKRLGISRNAVSKKLKCTTLCEMMCVFYCLDMLATNGIKAHDYEEMSEIIEHFYDKYYSLITGNQLVKSCIDFMKESIDRIKNL